MSLFCKLNLEPGKKIIVPRSGMSNDFVTRSLTNLGLDITELFWTQQEQLSQEKSGMNSFIFSRRAE